MPFRIREVADAVSAANAPAVAAVQALLAERFPALDQEDIEQIPRQLADPMEFGFRSILFVAEKGRNLALAGFALLLHDPQLKACVLEYVAARPEVGGRGIGSALYERLRDHARFLDCIGIFFESLPDDPALSPDPKVCKANADRLRFYERFGARPIINTAYETPLEPDGTNPPYLVFDDLGSSVPLPRRVARRVARAILERKYEGVCPPEYVERVVNSFRDDPVQIRPYRYRKPAPKAAAPGRPIPLVVNDRHDIHHVRERGYVESPVRVRVIQRALEGSGMFKDTRVRHYGEKHIRAVHERGLVDYLKRACANVPPEESVYPYVFPIRNQARPPRQLPLRAGYWCMDTFTPLNQNAYLAAVRAVDCALTTADEVLGGAHIAYALVRPPGHHAERGSYGGFCYFNSNAVAANYLSGYGRVAVLDVDYHHGNGTQDIFYRRADVFTVSLHGHPNYTYPYFSGFEEETGEDKGFGFNLNLPLPENLDGPRYRRALQKALQRIRGFKPAYLVVAFGADTAKGDPTGSFTLGADDFRENGKMIAELKLPTLVVQEGGYLTRSLGRNVRSFFAGLAGR